ncbi:phage major capsid protein [Rhodobacteraceae bacterium]|nr:phage major capsid protein [Paracoccaceae bacterium]
MSTPETTSRGGEAVPVPSTPADEVKTALAGLVGDITQQLQKQEDRFTMLDRKHTLTQSRRPALAAAADQGAPHQKAFAAYLRTGEDEGLRGLNIEEKALSTAVSAEGGYLVDPETSASVQSVLRSASSLRQVAKVVNVEATSYDVLIDSTEAGAGWASETANLTETATPTIDRISIPLHELSALPKISQRLLDDSAFDIEGWLSERIADTFARSEAAAFISGDGADKPVGFLTHSTVDNDNWAWGSLGYVPTGTEGGFNGTNPGDGLINLVYGLGARYRANASFILNSKTAGVIRRIKDAEGRFLWSDGLSAGEPARLLGYPVVISEDMPDIADGSLSVAFGDFGAGYTIAERPDLRILRDPFSAKPHVLFYATKRVGGDVSDFAAIKLLKFSNS